MTFLFCFCILRQQKQFRGGEGLWPLIANWRLRSFLAERSVPALQAYERRRI